MISLFPRISRLSARALLIGICNEYEKEPISYATGFVVRTVIGPCLLTARHCVTGRHHYDGSFLDRNAAIPFSISISHRTADQQGRVLAPVYIKGESLYRKDGSPRWFEHPKYEDLCDVVCLPLDNYDECEIFPVFTEQYATEMSKPNAFTDSDGFVLETGNRISLHVSDQVSVIGYPFGAVTSNVYPLWATGHLSSEPYNPSPFGVIYIDCRARGGQSGSPVYAVRAGSYESMSGDGVMFDGHAYMFIGIYSGRINGSSDIGVVWEASIVHDLITSLKDRASAKAPTERKIGSPITFMPTLYDRI